MLPKIRVLFSNEQRQRMVKKDLPLGKMYTFMLVRDPVEQFFSLFFFIRWACKFVDTPPNKIPILVPINWLTILTPRMQDAVCDGDVEYYLQHTTTLNPYSKILTGVGYHNVFERDVRTCHNAKMHFMTGVDLVLLNDDLQTGLELFSKTFVARSRLVTPSFDDARRTPVDELRERFRANATLIDAIASANHCDTQIFELAKKRYHTQLQEASLL
eukprot:m.98159 g.98159  ORF g.98159 m.98159 type:complete len:215 (-) comp12512_c0_seq3:1813-2457(-)